MKMIYAGHYSKLRQVTLLSSLNIEMCKHLFYLGVLAKAYKDNDVRDLVGLGLQSGSSDPSLFPKLVMIP